MKAPAYLGGIAVALTLGAGTTACTSHGDTGAHPRADSAQGGRPGTLEGPTRTDSPKTRTPDSGKTGMAGKGLTRMGNASAMSAVRPMDSTMTQMKAHMRMMDGAAADSLKAMLPMHRQMLANILGEMDAQMRSMKMTSDKRWTALNDSIRRDLVRMPTMSAQVLMRFMPGHRSRVVRLTDMHQSMF